ncbi:hypothetical protein GCM10022226_16140 [Sphaerisporangium flaviroseum]|uniref:Sigma factor regulator C-terminal domain-containing protein n=1 Tax=Sphaerisporangium flaviroseum TaxID=509199 RepID=A0ABP7HNY7_9ACTN
MSDQIEPARQEPARQAPPGAASETAATETAEAEFDIPDFDARKTRRAVRRGILRTSFTVLATLMVISLVATIGSPWVQRRGDRVQRMYQVLGTALQMANPGYNIELGMPSASPLSLSLEASIRPLRAVGGFSTGRDFGDQKDELTQDFFGHVQRPPLGFATETPLTYGLYNVGTGNQPKERMREVLARLPETMDALAVVEFTTPLTPAQLLAFGKQYQSCPDLVVYEHRPRFTPITWSPGLGLMNTTAPPFRGECVDYVPRGLADFRTWVGSLRDHDDANLRQFGLSLARLRTSAAEGKAYAYVDELSSIDRLRKIIEDPRVRTIRVADVSYPLE